MPIAIPAGVTVTLDGNVITVKGAKETLTRERSEEHTSELQSQN